MKLALPSVNDDGWNNVTGRHVTRRTSGSTLQPLKKPRLSLIAWSRSDDIIQHLNEVIGDSRATWRVAQEVLHSKPRQFYDDSECAQLINAFSDFFTHKLQTIRDTIGGGTEIMYTATVS